jgi:hypothetical protein
VGDEGVWVKITGRVCVSGKHPIHLGLQHEVILPTRTSHTNKHRTYIYTYIYIYLSIYLFMYMIVDKSCLDADVSCYPCVR